MDGDQAAVIMTNWPTFLSHFRSVETCEDNFRDNRDPTLHVNKNCSALIWAEVRLWLCLDDNFTNLQIGLVCHTQYFLLIWNFFFNNFISNIRNITFMHQSSVMIMIEYLFQVFLFFVFLEIWQNNNEKQSSDLTRLTGGNWSVARRNIKLSQQTDPYKTQTEILKTYKRFQNWKQNVVQ